ncbi:MAG: glycosyltransferase [Atopobiaceae bacterium]|nr:glycosyltransferase [Atopobiaceae bacterium]
MEWIVQALGAARGRVNVPDRQLSLAPGQSFDIDLQDMELQVKDGKFSDSEDSFLFLHTRIDPSSEDFRFSATLCATPTEAGADQQSGYGLMLADTNASAHRYARHRNQLFCGIHGRERALGVRLVSGYSSPDADETDAVRMLDASRVFASGFEDPFSGVPITLGIEKGPDGLIASFGDERIVVPGCDFLAVQDPDSICVGIALARNVHLQVSGISFETQPGSMSAMPEGFIESTISDYPFPASLLDVPAAGEPLHGAVIHAAPQEHPEADGSEERPFGIERALSFAGPGTRILCHPGTYRPMLPIVVPNASSGSPVEPVRLEAIRSRRCIIDGSALPERTPLFVLAASNWEVTGLVFRNGPLSGIVVCGSNNRIEGCEALGCGDTGVLIVAPAGTDPASWPAHNRIIDCDSHDNRDRWGSNADGFGAKLRIGPGNLFYRCIAHHNIDDGFDLYSKSLIGPIPPVELDSCIAYSNGMVSGDPDSERDGGGMGFKLGGEHQSSAHEVWNCLSYRNTQCGFSCNSNPDVSLHFCTSAGDGGGRHDSFVIPSAISRLLESGNGNAPVVEGLQKLGAPVDGSWEDEELPQPVRMENGSIALPAFFAPTRVLGKRIGADFGNKRILVLISSIGGGGAERVTCSLASELSKRHRVWLMYFHRKDTTYPLAPDVKLIDGTYKRNAREYEGILRKAVGGTNKLERRLLILSTRREHSIDSTLSMMVDANHLNAQVGGMRKVMSERNDPSRKSENHQRTARGSYRAADCVVFQSEKVRSMFASEVGPRGVIIPNPVGPDTVAAPVRAKRIVTMGRLIDQKNHALLIRAFAAFHADHPGYTLSIYGEGELEEELRSLAAELGVSGSVIFEGFREDIHEAIADAEMFVLSSDYEGLSNSLIEAMLMGIACISTDCTGSDELIHDGADGLLTPVGNVDALASAMAELADDPALREKLERNGMARRWEFSPENVVRQWERIL